MLDCGDFSEQHGMRFRVEENKNDAIFHAAIRV